MKEWERLHQQAKRYQAEYPPGTRIMLPVSYTHLRQKFLWGCGQHGAH